MDKSWMLLKNRMSSQHRDGVKAFVQFAMMNVGPNDKIRCPCMDCLNCEQHTCKIVEYHLVLKRMSPSYKTWMHHGESVPMNQSHALNDDNHNDFGSVRDRMEAETGEDQDKILNLLEDVYMGTTINDAENEEDEEDGDNDDDVANNVEKEGVPNFNKSLNDAQRELYTGCRKFSLLSFVVKMLHVKVLNKWSNKSFNMLLGILKDLLPVSDQVIPWTLYEAKKFLRALGLGYVSIHACKYDCALFWKENANLENCPICQESRYKSNYGKGKKVPHKTLRYFPLTSRLQRLYMSRKTAIDMRWHKEKRVDDGILRHPADGEAWKDFDRQHPLFSQESRNVRLGLATDGFNSFGNMSNSYSMWPVIVMPYNLPPWKCMKQSFSMLSLLILGPQAPGRDIDVYMRPLIDELKELWEDGVFTYDASTKLSFQMHAAVMWTINDFSAYGNLSG
ncbi:uncharacterized protein LOC114321997 [Camellia sinensis]|uniref:uncharacterized protein LOC114321997 n=1 Tax=Camellia sinensis TaxID=4442 RepID=UPI001036523C|nr:uncharacterized protein LOC114321997 [Camellia sinensis]